MGAKYMERKVLSEIFQAQVHMVAGKGGVGKTVVASALAHHFSLKYSTLFVELKEEESGEEPSRSLPIESLSPTLFRIKIFPDQALYEYLSIKLNNQKILNTLWSKRLFRAFASAVPGLNDLTRLGKIWFHANANNGLGPHKTFEKIVVDMPSTGFVSRFLSIASVVKEVVKAGPLAREAALIQDYFQKQNNARLHLVTLPLEIVVNETLELYQAILKRKDIHWGLIFINRLLVLPALEDRETEGLSPPIRAVFDWAKSRMMSEAEQLERLKAGLELPMISIPDQLGQIQQSLLLAAIGDILRAHDE